MIVFEGFPIKNQQLVNQKRKFFMQNELTAEAAKEKWWLYLNSVDFSEGHVGGFVGMQM